MRLSAWFLVQFAVLIAPFHISLAAEQFTVFSQHAWQVQADIELRGGAGIKWSFSDNNNARLKLLPHLVAGTGADIIALQELWNHDQVSAVREGFKEIRDIKGNLVYPYVAFMADYEPVGECHACASLEQFSTIEKLANLAVSISGTKSRMGNGLLILSKHPFCSRTSQKKFTQHTTLEEVVTMKGAINVCVDIPGIGEIEVFDSHLGAGSYDNEKGQFDKEIEKKRFKQIKELAGWLRDFMQAKPERPVILAGSLATHYYPLRHGKYEAGELSKEYRIFTSDSHVGSEAIKGLGMVDTFAKKNADALAQPVFTEDPNNLEGAAGDYVFKDEPSKVSDFIFMSKNDLIEPVYSTILRPKDLRTSAVSEYQLFASGQDWAHFVESVNALEDSGQKLFTHFGVITTFAKKDALKSRDR